MHCSPNAKQNNRPPNANAAALYLEYLACCLLRTGANPPNSALTPTIPTPTASTSRKYSAGRERNDAIPTIATSSAASAATLSAVVSFCSCITLSHVGANARVKRRAAFSRVRLDELLGISPQQHAA